MTSGQTLLIGLVAGMLLAQFTWFMAGWFVRRSRRREQAPTPYACWDSDCTLAAGHVGPHRGVAEGHWWR